MSDSLDLSGLSLAPHSTDHLVELGEIITGSIATIARVCKAGDIAFPGLDDAFHPASEAFRQNSEANAAADMITAAAFQLLAAVMPPPTMVMTLITGHMQTAALRVCLEANVTEILREAGPEGLHVDKIAELADLSSNKLARILRLLATRHVYKEITPDVFANTRLSTVLDVGKSVEALKADPAAKYNDSRAGFPALMGHFFDEVAKGSMYMWETLSDPAKKDSGKVTDAPFCLGNHTELSMWDFFDTPEQQYRSNRFNAGMRGIGALHPPDQILSACEWETLPEGALVVDVGGGVGTSTLLLAEKFEHLRVVVQDRPPVIEEGKRVWEAKLPGILASGRAKLEVHDFLTEQPIKGADIYLLGQILHDWADSYCEIILTHLRAAAGPATRLVLIEALLPFACRIPADDETAEISGAIPLEAPAPLLANFGVAGGMGYATDLIMMTSFNAQERTVKHVKALLDRTGWKLTKIIRTGKAGLLQPSIAIPV